ncbi:DNA repair and recombination protein RadB [Candidatus Woesearchaeota archaeon]|jgi:DNA repair protein RadB|nr:DNA repair and recombination protein RadB [Candidatus Woesearchaeota archaeon]MBT6520215.1 DNA repair and recombination protein RadB [Candidatus Woesearchaeota archaeon]
MNEIKKDTEINAQESSENIASLDSKQKNCTSISGRIPTGSEVLDKLLKGGFEKETISTIYGPSGCGKTNFCLISAVEMVKTGKKVIFVDSEGGFSIERLKQITGDCKETLNGIILLKPTRFDEQKRAFQKIKQLITDDIGIIIVDTISMLYRLELGKNEEIYNINRELGLQISQLTEICRKQKIPVLVTTQVYANFEEKDQVKIVGGDILKYGSKCLIELRKLRGSRVAILKKHRSIKEGEEIKFRIENEGVFEND